MRTIQSQLTSSRKLFTVRRLWLAAVVVLLPAGPQARADLREAVKKLLPATVAVEWRSVDTESALRTEVFRIKNAKAELVAEAVKDVYRHLLSEPDKSPGGKSQQQQRSDYYYDYYGSTYGRKTAKGKGSLSIGVDATSNSVVVSAPGSHFGEIKQLIQALDEARKPAARATDESSQGKRTVSGTVVPSETPEQDAVTTGLRWLASAARTRKTPDTVVLASGAVLSSDGLIATLPGEAEKGTYTVTFHDGRTLPAKLVVDDRRSGLKLLRVDADNLPYVELADEEAELGQQVVAVLSTDVKNRTVAQGIVASRSRRHQDFVTEVFQTDIGIDAMSAGAPLSNANGKLLGLVAGKAHWDEHRQGPAFVVPADYVKSLVEARHGDETVVIHRPILGVQIGESAKKKGAVVERVFPDSAAETVGIREGDEITVVDGQEVTTPDDVTRYIRRRKPGDQATVVIRRDGKEKRLQATLGMNETRSQTTKAGSRRIERTQPGNLLILDSNGRLQVMREVPDALHFIPPEDSSATPTTPEQQRKRQEAILRARRYLSPKSTTVRVQRSDVEKKVDQLNSDVKSLASQMEKLIEEVGKLRGQLEDD